MSFWQTVIEAETSLNCNKSATGEGVGTESKQKGFYLSTEFNGII